MVKHHFFILFQSFWNTRYSVTSGVPYYYSYSQLTHHSPLFLFTTSKHYTLYPPPSHTVHPPCAEFVLMESVNYCIVFNFTILITATDCSWTLKSAVRPNMILILAYVIMMCRETLLHDV